MSETKKKEEFKFDEKKILGKLKHSWDIGIQYYLTSHRKMRLLDATDKGDLWKAIGAKFPPYQLLPDTNWVSYVKNNILASIYTVAKSADIVPTSEEDVDITQELSIALEYEWDKNKVGFYQFLAGERAALLNLGITQVGWDAKEDEIYFANIDPIRFMRDPFSENLQDAGWCVTYNNYHKSVFLNDSKYRDTFKTAIEAKKITTSTEELPDYRDRISGNNEKDHYNLYIWWIKNKEGGIDEIHTIDHTAILYHKENIKPNLFPFAELYCNLPGSSLIGVSEPAKIYANNLVYNMLNSIALTGEYKNQRPPKFVNRQSGLNIAAFSKHGTEADRTFIVNGDASKAVHYHEFPQVTAMTPQMLDKLTDNIEQISGVDGRYTGRDTGSIITTGGTEEMLNRVTLIDTPKVMCYENYVCDLTKLVLKTLLEFAPKRNYLVKNPDSTTADAEWVTTSVDFPNVDSETVFDYVVQISSELPKNKQRVQAWANNMMEKQMQYKQEGLDIELLTVEEWLRMQDIPYKEQMLERMGVDRRLNALLEANTVINEYADMIEQGVNPNDAMLVAAEGLEALRSGQTTPYQDAMAAQTDPLAGMTGGATQTGESIPAEDLMME